MTLSEQVEILRQARDGLHMRNMDTRGVDKMLAQHGVDISALPQHTYAAVAEFQGSQVQASQVQHDS